MSVELALNCPCRSDDPALSLAKLMTRQSNLVPFVFYTKKLETMEPHPRRPVVKPGEFVGLTSSKAVSVRSNAVVKPHILCSKCMPIRTWLEVNRDVEEKEEIGFEHHSVGTDMEGEYLNGCHLCTLFWAAFDSTFISSGEKEIRMDKVRKGKNGRVVLRRSSTRDTTLFEIQLDIGPSEERLFSEKIEIAASEHYPPAKKFPFYEEIPIRDYSVELSNSSVAISTSSSSVLQLAYTWLGQCTDTHKQCLSSSNSSNILPKRLLDVGVADEVLKLRNIPADGSFSGIKYVALSYCWGKTEGLKLTKSNMEDLALGFSYEMLPRTIRDAVIVTRKLGYRWLWVDSLCIIQDSPEDWKQEAISMVDVYSNCDLCIAATGAEDSDDGLFTQRDPLIYTPCRMTLYAGKAIYAFPSQSAQQNFWCCFKETTLHKRGWVMQELILPARTLSFGSVLFWDCREHCRDEFNVSTVMYGETTAKGRLSELVLQRDSKTQPINAELKLQIWALWHEVLREYTDANLSVKTDRVIAISGIISAIERATGWRNISGLWEPFLLCELLWGKLLISGTTREVAVPEPSWSWATTTLASICHGFSPYTDFENEDLLAQVIDVPPSGIEIRISCVLFKFRNSSEVVPFGSNNTLPEWPEKDRVAVHLDLADSMAPEFFLPIKDNPHDWYYHGLALISVPSLPETYRRIGYIESSYPDEMRPWPSFHSDPATRQVITLI